MIFEKKLILSKKEATMLRKHYLSNLECFALENMKIIENTTAMNSNLIAQFLLLIPIYSNDDCIGKKVIAYCNYDFIEWTFPPNSGLDCDFKPTMNGLLENQQIIVEFTICKGKAEDDIKFSIFNACGLEFYEDYILMKLESQRKSAMLFV
jgi:hypothetical protein